MREFKDSLSGETRHDEDDDDYVPLERSSTKS
jgi:hypothetical protein